MIAATTSAGTAITPMQIQYHFSEYSAYRQEPVPPHTYSGMISDMQNRTPIVFKKVTTWQ